MVLLARKQAVLFDMDGVLFHSSESHAEALREVLACVGIRDFEYASYAGMRTDDVLRRVLTNEERAADDATIARLVTQKRARAAELLRARRPIAQGCADVLNRLSPTHRLALATSGSRESATLFLEMSGFARFFRSVVCGEDVREAKPAPDVFLRTLEILGARPDDALVVEDSLSGITAARAAGIDAVGVAGTCSRAHLLGHGAVAVIDDIRELVRP